MSCQVRPSNLIQTFAFADDFSFAVLQSSTHWRWFVAKCSKLTERFRYNPTTIFLTFPWPQSPGKKDVDAVAVAGREVRRVREAAREDQGRPAGGVSDAGVARQKSAQGRPRRAGRRRVEGVWLFGRKDLLGQILELNREVAGRIDRGQPVTAPGVPTDYPDPERLVTDDCVQP